VVLGVGSAVCIREYPPCDMLAVLWHVLLSEGYGGSHGKVGDGHAEEDAAVICICLFR